ncbi:putative saccharomyces cerevisiae YJR111C [Lyophyllum shimeji]|uniref:Saccharomyces cerevisiae YJR111C n=1 Tax=Lyophyllum shimeji TaxID=47721 RepID=A0A9P3PGN5_LYOSH|nr:putative saccharomyces cerevisiae YJR111C [Lyophyllum shimeji]
MGPLATTGFLNHLKSIYPRTNSSGLFSNPWYIITAVAFCSSNRPEEVPFVFQHALSDLKAESDSHEEQLLLARKVRDALFKAGLTAGYPRTINSLVALNEIMPKALRDTTTMRRTDTIIEQYAKTGEALFRSIYGETADSVQSLLDTVYPDMGWFSNTIGYGLTYGYTDILSPLETSYTLVAALIASDSPRQIQWHLDGARRRGATYEEVQAVRTISMEVAKVSGITWRDGVPEVKDMVG